MIGHLSRSKNEKQEMEKKRDNPIPYNFSFAFLHFLNFVGSSMSYLFVHTKDNRIDSIKKIFAYSWELYIKFRFSFFMPGGSG